MIVRHSRAPGAPGRLPGFQIPRLPRSDRRSARCVGTRRYGILRTCRPARPGCGPTAPPCCCHLAGPECSRVARCGAVVGRAWLPHGAGPAGRLGREGSDCAVAAAGRSWRGARVGGHPDELDRGSESSWQILGSPYSIRIGSAPLSERCSAQCRLIACAGIGASSRHRPGGEGCGELASRGPAGESRLAETALQLARN